MKCSRCSPLWKWPWTFENGRSPGVLPFPARAVEMTSIGLVKMRKAAISNVPHFHPTGDGLRATSPADPARRGAEPSAQGWRCWKAELGTGMRRHLHISAAVGAVLSASVSSRSVLAQKTGGILRIPHADSPASMSTHEEATRSTATPMMGVFNNLVLFDQHVPQNTLSSIVSDLAVAWSWDEDKTALTFRLRQNVRWHDGKPFSPKDVKCTWDLLTGKSNEKLRVNPRRSWYRNLEEVTVDNDNEVTFHLKRPQPFFPVLLASAVSPVYPCHVPPAQMRQHPIGTGPFKFLEYKPNESIRLSRNADYWKPGRPYL